MAINNSNGVFLPDIILLTQAPPVVWFDGIFIVYCYYLVNYVLYYTILHCNLF